MPRQIQTPPSLVMRQGPHPYLTYILERKINTIGRDVENDIVIDEGHLSAHHALVTEHSDGWVIEDLASRSGVWVNGHPIKSPVFLREGVRINLGPNVMLEAQGQAFGSNPHDGSSQKVGLSSILLAAFIILFLFIIAFISGYYFLYK